MNGISCYKETSTNENNQKTAKTKQKNTRQTYVCISDPSSMTLVLNDSF